MSGAAFSPPSPTGRMSRTAKLSFSPSHPASTALLVHTAQNEHGQFIARYLRTLDNIGIGCSLLKLIRAARFLIPYHISFFLQAF